MVTTRIFDADLVLLRTLAAQTGKRHRQIIHEALERYHRGRMLDDINAAFAQLKADPVVWRDEQAERTVWDAAAAESRSTGL